jgi:hypothetical protein
MVQWNDFIDVIPNVSSYTDPGEWSDDDYSDTSQSMEELNEDDTFGGQEDDIFESLDELALDEMATEVGNDKANTEAMPKQDADSDLPELDSSEVGSMSSDGKANYGAAAAGLLSGGIFVGAHAFVMDKISSLRSTAAGNDDEGLDVVSEAVDVDDIQNAAKTLGNNAYTAASEPSRNGSGLANITSSTPPGVESAA